MLQQASTFFDTLTIQDKGHNTTHERVGFAPRMHLSASMKLFFSSITKQTNCKKQDQILQKQFRFHAVANIEATGQKVEQL